MAQIKKELVKINNSKNIDHLFLVEKVVSFKPKKHKNNQHIVIIISFSYRTENLLYWYKAYSFTKKYNIDFICGTNQLSNLINSRKYEDDDYLMEII